MSEGLSTSRLDLRLFSPADADELHVIFADPETNTVGSGPFTALSQTQSWIDNRQAAFRDHGLVWYALRLCESGELIGNCGMLRGRSTCVEPELGYMISLAHQGRGCRQIRCPTSNTTARCCRGCSAHRSSAPT